MITHTVSTQQLSVTVVKKKVSTRGKHFYAFGVSQIHWSIDGSDGNDETPDQYLWVQSWDQVFLESVF